MNDFGISHAVSIIQQEICGVTWEMNRPSFLFKPKLTIDGNQWCALYGKDLHDGVAGFGESPAKAMEDFDKEWIKPLSERKARVNP